MSNRTVAVVSVLALMLAACPKKQDTSADAAAEAAAAATTAPATADTPSTATATATATAGGAKVAPATPKVDAGPTDAGAGGDSGALVDTCCCEVPGQPLTQLGQSECTKGKKGQCVKKEKCAAAPAPDAGPPAQQCCCDTAGKKELRGQSECTKAGAGKCVKMTECKK
jgi:hypothetical protein